MNHFVLWAVGLLVLWGGLRIDDEAVLLASLLVGTALIIWGLVMAPIALQLAVEITAIAIIFFVCMQCIERGTRS